MAARSEGLDDGTIRGQETLGLSRGLKPLHMPFPLAGGLAAPAGHRGG
jgi:hypothetical protein